MGRKLSRYAVQFDDENGAAQLGLDTAAVSRVQPPAEFVDDRLRYREPQPQALAVCFVVKKGSKAVA